MVSAKRDSHTIARKVFFFKESSALQNDTSADEDESDDDDVQITEAKHAKRKIAKNPLAYDDPRETWDNPIGSDFEQTKKYKQTLFIYIIARLYLKLS